MHERHKTDFFLACDVELGGHAKGRLLDYVRTSQRLQGEPRGRFEGLLTAKQREYSRVGQLQELIGITLGGGLAIGGRLRHHHLGIFVGQHRGVRHPRRQGEDTGEHFHFNSKR